MTTIKNEVKAAETLNAVSEFSMEYRDCNGSKVEIYENDGEYTANVYPKEDGVYLRKYVIQCAQLPEVVMFILSSQNKPLEAYLSERGIELSDEERMSFPSPPEELTGACMVDTMVDTMVDSVADSVVENHLPEVEFQSIIDEFLEICRYNLPLAYKMMSKNRWHLEEKEANLMWDKYKSYMKNKALEGALDEMQIYSFCAINHKHDSDESRKFNWEYSNTVEYIYELAKSGNECAIDMLIARYTFEYLWRDYAHKPSYHNPEEELPF